ncbi:MAG: hypothetical protein JAZ17_19940, partial [Candidatus Thiodiazotropha endolucinida]|nr:hypothetical protein [Candidatus Thiodiazotropha endolucinida]
MKNTEGYLRLTVFSAGNKRYTLTKHRRAITPHIQKSFYLFVVLCITFLSGCKNPYALRIDSVDYSRIGTDYANAAIQMSPPTIYARETLINDRRREHEYLKGVLEGSKAKTFESELRRELTNISALSASLGLSFDQGAKEEFLKQRALSESETNLTLERLSAASQQLGLQQAFENDRLASITEQNQLIDQRNALLQQGQVDQAELQQQLALENLRLELMRQQYEVERLQSIIDDNRERASLADQSNQGEQPGQERQSTALDALPDSNAITTVTPGTPLASGLSLQNNPPVFTNRDLSAISLSSADSQSTMSSLNAKLTHALNLLQTEAKKAQGVDVSLSPEQEFAARQAYRRTIRSAIAENNLDDLHDKGGNSLFRLQFTATVLPGKDANRWGMATYRLSPPNATKDNLENLYNEWLTHVTLRLNEAADSRGNGERPLGLSDIRYELLQSTGLYDIARFYQNEKGQINPINNCFVADSLEVANSYNCISIPLAVPPKSSAEFTSAKLYWDHILLNVLYAKLVDAIASGKYNAITEYHKSSNAANRTLNNFYKVTSLEVAIKELHDLAQSSGIENNKPFNEMILKLSVNAKNYREKNNYLDEAGVSEARAQVIQNDFNKKYNVLTETEKSTSAGDSESGSTEQENDTLPSTPPSEVQLIEVLKTLTLKQLGEILPANEVLKRVRVYRQLGPSVVKSAEGVISRINLKKGQREVIMQIMERLARNVAISHQAIPVLAQLDIGEDELTLASLFPELLVETEVLPRITLKQLQPGTGISICPPRVFAGAVLASGTVFDPKKLSDCGLEKGAKFAGDARPYSTTPRIRSQRISTVTSAVDAFELGLSLAAKAPSAGLRGDAGIGLARTAAGKVQAREQVPLVVGFAASRGDHPIRDLSTQPDNSTQRKTSSGGDSSEEKAVSSRHSTKNQDAKFGWVFGPRTIVDAEDQSLKLAQQVATHDVTADISMPGWWPYAKANLKTSWVGDEWRTGGLEASNAKTQTLNIKLAQTQADMDGLADFVSQKIIGKSLQAAHISSVFPKSISLCRDTAHLVLH